MVDANCVLDGLLPLGDGCDAIPSIKNAIFAMSAAICADCAGQVADDVLVEDFVEELWGSPEQISPRCDTLLVQRENGQTYISFDQGTTWTLIYDETSTIQNARYRSGLTVNSVSTTPRVQVGVGEIMVNGVRVEKQTGTNLDITTAGDWLSGSVPTLASNQRIGIYINPSGNIKFHDAMPNYSVPVLTNRVFTGLINEPTFNGTIGKNAVTVHYDNDTGEGNVRPGMLMGVYEHTADTDYSIARRRGDFTNSSRGEASFALIDAINTGTNTLTLIAGHNISLTDNDRLIAIEPGELLYRFESAQWWRLIDVVQRTGSPTVSLNHRQSHFTDTFTGGATTTSATYVGTAMTGYILSRGGPIQITFTCTVTATQIGRMDVNMDGLRVPPSSSSDTVFQTAITTGLPVTITLVTNNVPPGTHYFEIMWNIAAAGTFTIVSSNGGFNFRPVLSVKDMRSND